MRLIDTDKNREDFKKTVYRILKDDFSTSKVKFNKIMTAFDSMPTAYDIDKVVEELEKIQDKAVSVKNEDVSIYATGMIGKAIEIVKQGGVTDDVCEWEKQNDYPEVYSTKCGIVGACRKNSFSCPYCGKKLKVVE